MMVDVFISHHTNSSLHIVEAIVNNLEAGGVKCWYAPRNTTEDYARSISEAINACKLFLLVLNKDSSESPHVLNELNKVTKRLSKKEEVHIIPFHTADDEISEEADYYIGRMHWIDAMTPPLEQRISELCDRVRMILGERQDMAAENGSKQYRIVSSKIYADDRFKGREAELEEIHALLNSYKNKVFLAGMGGSGKSELAKKYCQEYSSSFENVIWVSFHETLLQTISNDSTFPIKGLYRSDHLDKDSRGYFAYKLQVLKELADKKTLIVIDNFDVEDDTDLDDFCMGEYAVLFTTRSHGIRENMPEIALPKLEEENQLELFQEIYKRKLAEQDKDYITQILNILDSHTLSIRLVASIMNENRIRPEKMLDILKNNTNNKANIIYDRLKDMLRLTNLTDEEIYLLRNLSLISIQGIEVERFIEWCGREDYDDINRLIKKSWVIHSPVDDVVSLHPIVADLFLEQLKENPDSCEKLLNSFCLQCRDCHSADYLYKQWLFHLADYINKRLPEAHPMMAKVKLEKGRMLQHLSLYMEAIEVYKKLIPILTEKADRLAASCSLAHLYCISGFPQLGLETAQRVITEFFPKTEDMSIYSKEELYHYHGLLQRLVEANRMLENYNEAVKCAEAALDFILKYPVSNLIWSKYHFARTLYMRNEADDIEKSEKIFLEGVKLCQEADDKWSINYFYQFLGQIHMKKGDFDLALSETQKAFQELLFYYGEVSVGVAMVNLMFGNIYRWFNNETKAVEFYEKAIDIFGRCGIAQYSENAKKVLNSGKIGYVN